MNGWTALIIAGLMEVAFTTCMKLSRDFTRLPYTILFGVFAVASFAFLSRAMTTIPLGTAYAVWTGIGATGTAAVGILFFDDPATALRIFFLVTLIGSIAGLKLAA